jgi:hypothetical protein
MRQYSFVTHWRFRAPVEDVWEAIRAYERWPSWWPSIAEARRVRAGDPSGLGETVRLSFRTRLPYQLKFTITTTRVEPLYELDGRAEGELNGSGRWRLRREGNDTLVTYYWDVSTSKRWMNLLAPVLRPAFEWNHDQVMTAGEQGLRRLLARQAKNVPALT